MHLGNTSRPWGNSCLVAGKHNRKPITTLLAILISVLPSYANTVVNFADSNLEAVIREAINKPTRPIYERDLTNLTHLNATNRDIIDLSGLDFCVSLVVLKLGDNKIVAINELSHLTDLKRLELGGNNIMDIGPIRDLTNLETLWLGRNQIKDVNLLEKLTNLTCLVLKNNEITDIGVLSRLKRLASLDLGDNSIIDIEPLLSLVGLEHLWLGASAISDIAPLANLVNLKSLELRDNYITDIRPLRRLTNLSWLGLNRNFISDISSLSDLINLTELHLEQNCIKSIEALQGATKLAKLHVHKNWIGDASALSQNPGIARGDTVDISHNLLKEKTYREDIPVLRDRLGDENLICDPYHPNSGDPHVLDFPIYWGKWGPYNKFVPTNDEGHRLGVACGAVAQIMIIRYWSLQKPLLAESTYWYRGSRGDLYSFDFGSLCWESMLPCLHGLRYEDPRVDPVAELYLASSVASRCEHTYWPGQQEDRFFGIDNSRWTRLHISHYVLSHSWDDFFAQLNGELDEGRPCILTLVTSDGGCHHPIITGYKRFGERYRYSIHIGGRDYDPSVFYDLGQPVGGWDAVDKFRVAYGWKPFEPGKAPTYNKTTEIPGETVSSSGTALEWNGREYAACFPVRTGDEQWMYFQRISASGLTSEEPEVIPNCGPYPQNPCLKWANGNYGFAYESGDTNSPGAYFNILSIFTV